MIHELAPILRIGGTASIWGTIALGFLEMFSGVSERGDGYSEAKNISELCALAYSSVASPHPLPQIAKAIERSLPLP